MRMAYDEDNSDWKLRFAFLPVKLRTGRVWLRFYWSRFCGDHYEVEPLVHPMPNMLAAFRTEVIDGQDSLYEMRFKLRNLHNLQCAGREWIVANNDGIAPWCRWCRRLR